MVRKVGRPWSLILEFCKRLSQELSSGAMVFAILAALRLDFLVRGMEVR